MTDHSEKSSEFEASPIGGRFDEFANGWRPLLGAFMGITTGVYVIFMHTYGVLMPMMSEEFGGTRTQWSLPVTVMSIVATISAPIIGKMVDRFGPVAVSFTALLFAAATFQLASIFIDGYASVIAFAVAIAIFGSGTHNSTYLYALGGYFKRSRGLAIGFVLSGTGVCGAVAPILTTSVTQSGGWRAGYTLIATVLVIAAVVIAGLLWKTGRREKREAHGQGPADSFSWGLTLAEARRTPTFWKAAVVIFLFSFATTGQVPHFVSMVLDRGIDAQRAAGMASIIGISIVVGRLGSGFLLDRVFVKNVGIGFLLISAVGLGIIAFGDSWSLPFGVFCLGLGLGAEVDLAAYIVARYFGNRHYGSIFGWLFAAYATGSMLSAVTAGKLYDLTGSYIAGLSLAMVLLVAATPIFLTFARYPRDAS